jgi:DNA invertase Pin-like site-specific DNA recombinase
MRDAIDSRIGTHAQANTNPEGRKNVATYAYTRASVRLYSPGNDDAIADCDEQAEAIIAYAKDKGIEIARIFTDCGFSGETPIDARPSGANLLGTLRAGDTIVVKSLDRLARSPAELLKVVERLAQLQAKLVILSPNPYTFDLGKPADKMEVLVFLTSATWEAEAERARTEASLDKIASWIKEALDILEKDMPTAEPLYSVAVASRACYDANRFDAAYVLLTLGACMSLDPSHEEGLAEYVRRYVSDNQG